VKEAGMGNEDPILHSTWGRKSEDLEEEASSDRARERGRPARSKLQILVLALRRGQRWLRAREATPCWLGPWATINSGMELPWPSVRTRWMTTPPTSRSPRRLDNSKPLVSAH
jgi:hypothetical protein